MATTHRMSSNLSFICLTIILSITSRICSSTFTTGTAQLDTANYAMAVGYDAHNDTILLFGGWFSQTQFITFKDDTFTLIDANFLTQQAFIMSQYYTQLNNILWMINKAGDDFIKFNTNTYHEESTSITISNSHVGKCLTSIENHLIVIGGDSGSSTYNTVDILRINDNQWLSNVPPLKTARTSLSCVAVNLGFVLFTTFLDDIETLNVSDINTISTQEWNAFGAVLNAGRRGTRSVVVNTDIWVIGGFYSPDVELSDVNVIDTLAVTCSVFDTLSYKTSFAASILVQNVLYVFGGCLYQDGSGCVGDNRYQYSTLQATTADPTTTTSDPTTVTSEPTIFTSDPTIVTPEPTTVTSEPTISTSEPTILTSEPTISTSNPTISTSEPTISTSEPTIFTSNPTVSTSEPTLLTSEPTILTSNSAALTSESTSLTLATTIFTSYPTRAPIATSLTPSVSESVSPTYEHSANPSTKLNDGKVIETYSSSSVSQTAVNLNTPHEADNILVILLVAISSLTIVSAILYYVLKYIYSKRKKKVEQELQDMNVMHVPYPGPYIDENVGGKQHFAQTKLTNMVTKTKPNDEALDEIEGKQNNANNINMEYTQEGQKAKVAKQTTTTVTTDRGETKQFEATHGAV